MSAGTDVESLIAMLRELGWSPHTERDGFPIELQEHYDQGVRDGLMVKPMPELHSRAYLLGWVDGRIGKSALKVMKMD